MKQPPGYIQAKSKFCKLKRSICGLKNLSNMWNADLIHDSISKHYNFYNNLCR